MQFVDIGRLGAFFAVGACLALTACQSGEGLGSVLPGSSGQTERETVRLSELRAYCPTVRLRSGTASFRTYERNGENDPDKIIYQASISDVTRKCTYDTGAIGMTVAVAGRVVPGPAGKTGTITMPIRVAVVRGEEVLYSQLHEYPVSVNDIAGATQFVFSDPNIVIPTPTTQNIVVFAGYDEGPPE